jgi:hypothetical protein
MKNHRSWLASLLVAAFVCTPVLAQDRTVTDTTLSPQSSVKLHNNGDGSYSRASYISGGDMAIDPTTAAVASAQQTCTSSAVALPSQAYTNGFIITAQTTNVGVAYIGGSGVTTSTGYPLKPGQSIAYNAANSNQAYLICDSAAATASDKIAITGN